MINVLLYWLFAGSYLLGIRPVVVFLICEMKVAVRQSSHVILIVAPRL